MAGLTDIFTTAVRGLNVNQGAINTTAHNIANAHTTGYSRQRAVIETTRPFGGMSRFDTCAVGQMGTGAEVTSVQRVRDSFIDYQVRSETGTSGYYTSKSETLSNVEDVFGEPSDKGIEELMTKFYNAFQEVSKNPSSQDVKSAAIKQASALADQINYAYNQLEKTSQNNQDVLDTNVTDVNSYLDQINELNKQIRGVSAVGQTPNDLMDKRDNLLDELSSKFGIKNEKDKFETINLSSTEYPDSPLVKSDPNDTDYNRFSYIKSAVANTTGTTPPVYNGTVTVQYYPLGNEKATLQTITIGASGATTADQAKNAKDLADELTQNRILLADKYGNVAEQTTTTQAISSTSLPSIGTLNMPATIPGETITTSGTMQTITKAVVDGAGIKTITVTSSPIDEPTTIPAILKTAKTYVTDTAGAIQSGTMEQTIKDAPTAASNLQKMEFVSYKYESGINNVDNNNIKGEIAGNQSVQEYLKNMMGSLDKLAEGLAYTVNAIQTGSTDSSVTTQGLDNNPIFINNDKYTGTPSTTTDDGITAKNLKINSALVSNPSKLNCKTTSTSGEGDGKRAAAISNLSTLKMKISDVTDTSNMTRKQFLNKVGIDTTTNSSAFTDSTCIGLKSGIDGSTTDTYYKSMINELGVETQEASRKVDNQEVILAKLEDDKSQVSGVSIDEETTNLIQYQHAYQANAKMISTIDQLLDVVINGLMK